MYCKHCGTQFDDTMSSCPSCGTPVNLPKARPVSNVTAFIVLGIIFALVSTLFFPPLFGGLGIYFGYRVKKEKDGLGIFLMILNLVCMIFGMILGAILGQNLF